MTPIFKIVHPNGTPAEVRAARERDALDLLIRHSNDLDWEFSQVTSTRKEPGDPVILQIGIPLIPTTTAHARPRHEGIQLFRE
jgi:hypothetical protein